MPLPRSLKEMSQIANPKGVYAGVSLGLDPGHTTGAALIHDFRLIWARQLETSHVENTYDSIRDLFDEVLNVYDVGSIQIACEDYKVYDWKAESHSWSKVHTIKVVGLIQFLAYEHRIPIKMRMASAAKGWMTDDKLRTWGLYVEGQRHSRDAIRHAAYNAIFNDSHISE